MELNPKDLFYHGLIHDRDRDSSTVYAWFTTKDEETHTFIVPMLKEEAKSLKENFGNPVLPEEAGIFLNTES